MEGSKTLFCSSKSSWTRERISSKFLVWARALQNVRQPWYSLSCVFVEETFKSGYYENRESMNGAVYPLTLMGD